MFWSISYHLGAFGTVKLPYESQGKTFRISAKVRDTKSRVIYHDERTRSTPLDLKLMFWCVSYHLGPLCFLTKLRAKRSELVQKFVPRSRVGIFGNESTRPTPWDPKLMFWCISYHLGPLGCLTKLRAKWAKLVQKCEPRSRVGFFSRRMHPIHPMGP